MRNRLIIGQLIDQLTGVMVITKLDIRIGDISFEIVIVPVFIQSLCIPDSRVIRHPEHGVHITDFSQDVDVIGIGYIVIDCP